VTKMPFDNNAAPAGLKPAGAVVIARRGPDGVQLAVPTTPFLGSPGPRPAPTGRLDGHGGLPAGPPPPWPASGRGPG
jgi:hypothetical protein